MVAVNELVAPERMANLLRHDSVFGPFAREVQLTEAGLAIGGESVELFAEPEPTNLPWKGLEVDVVVESTGRFTSRDLAAASAGRLQPILDYSEEPLVSSDVIGSRASCIVDAPLTMALGNLVKVFGWYDNEFGYACRLVDLARVVGASSR